MIRLIVFASGLLAIFATITREPDGFFRCPTDPITLKYPDPNDKTCKYYFLCHRGHAVPKVCSYRFAFHPAIGECIPRAEVPEKICKPEIKCKYNGYYPDPLDCTKYYICLHQHPEKFGCTSGFVYIHSKSQCIKNQTRAYECSRPRPLPQFTPVVSTNPPAKLISKKSISINPSKAKTTTTKWSATRKSTTKSPGTTTINGMVYDEQRVMIVN